MVLTYLVFEYLEGQTVADRISDKGRSQYNQALDYATQMERLRSKSCSLQGITHRDEMPNNVMLTRSGAKLIDVSRACDFSMAAIAEAALLKRHHGKAGEAAAADWGGMP